MDVVIPYKASRSRELIYAVRSLVNLPHERIYIIGDQTILDLPHIIYKQSSDIATNTLNIIDIAVRTHYISEDFIWMADDMYIMKPIEKIPVYHRGTYADILEGYKDVQGNFYVDRMRKTDRMLRSMGIEYPLCYEAHIPFVINKEKWRKVRGHITPKLNKLSMYGNLNKIGGTYMNDVKVRTRDWVPDGTFISTHEQTFDLNQVGTFVRTTFKKKSEYEK